MLGIPIEQLALLAAALLAGGVATGLLAGLFGVGGGAIVVPVLYQVFTLLGAGDDAATKLAVGTSLAVIVPTSIQSFRAHRAKGAVDMSVLRQWAVPVVIGVVLGSLVARHAPAALFKGVFVAVATASAIRLLFGRDSWRIADEMPGPLVMRLYGGLIGVLSSLMGIGGGQLSNLFMTFHGQPIHRAVATSSGLGILISIPGILGYAYAGWPAMMAGTLPPLSIGFVSLLGLALVAPTSTLMAPYGARLAHRLPKRKLEVAFGVFLVLVSLNFVVSLARH